MPSLGTEVDAHTPKYHLKDKPKETIAGVRRQAGRGIPAQSELGLI